MKTALKITPVAEKPRLAAPAASARRRVALRMVAPAETAPRQSTALRSARSGGHERVLRALDRLALLGMVIAIALMPVLAAGHSAKQPAVTAATAGNDDDLGFFRALSAVGYAIWRPAPALNRPVSSPSHQDRGAPAPRHFPSTN